ncbi:MAG: hypothetical protein ABMB14_20555 [Myxococcota bacterium]
MVGAALVACGVDPSVDPAGPADPVETLSAPGPYAVGYREESVTWSDPLLDAGTRTLRLAVWFPTDAEAGPPVKYDGVFDAPGVLGGVDPAAGPHPLAVFSHGHQGFAESSGFLAVHLASHGWWVVSPDHTGNTTFDPPDRETEIYWARPVDLSAVLDHAEQTLELDGTTVAIGHSFGGYTVHGLGGAASAIDALAPGCADGSDGSEFCSTMTDALADRFRAGFGDPRVAAVIAMAPGDYRLYGEGLAAIDVPELLMTGGLDPGTDGDPIWAALDDPDDRRVTLPTAAHNTFTDFAAALDPDGAIDPDEGHRIIGAYALAFAEVHGRLDPFGAGILDGTDPVSDLAAITAH